MIKLEIITPNGPYKCIDTPSLTVGTIDGERGLLEHHMPVVLILDISKLITVENNEKKIYAISGGVLFLEDGKAKVLVDAIESQDEIDIERAKNAKDRAEKHLKSRNTQIDIKRAELALKRSLNRLHVANM